MTDETGAAAAGGTGLIVRPATPRDVAGIESLRLACFPRVFDTTMGHGGRHRKLAALTGLRACLPDPVAGVMVAVTADGVVVGHAAYTTSESDPGSARCRARAVATALGPLRTARFLFARQFLFLQHEVAPGEAYISDIAVAERWRGHRLSDRIVTAAERHAAERGATSWVALVGVTNAPSRALMTRLGYTPGAIVTKPLRGRLLGEGELVRYEKRA